MQIEEDPHKLDPPIKLCKLSEIDGATMLQSQLYIKKDVADFKLIDGRLYCFGFKKGEGFDYYRTYEPYEIVSREEMLKQES